jgi:hypothetical protein
MSDVQLVKKEVEVTKEVSEVFTAVAAIVADFRAGKSATEIAMGNLVALETAVEGCEKIPAEIKDSHVIKTAVVGLAEIVEALLAKHAAVVA